MIAFVEIPPIIDQLDKEAKVCSEAIAMAFTDESNTISLPRDTDLLTVHTAGLIYIVKGIFRFLVDGRLVRLYSAGDLVTCGDALSANGCRCISEFGSAIIHITPAMIVDAHQRAGTPFTQTVMRYQSLQSTIMHMLCAAYIPTDLRPEYSMVHFAKDSIIIAEGDPAHDIYLLVQGKATVTVNKVLVGTIEAGEVFGEISFFTKSTRTATVTAQAECIVQVMNKADFLTIIKIKPSVNLSISKTLSQRLVDANRLLAGES